jgi:Terminase small subunit.
MKELTPKEKKFIENYTNIANTSTFGNATQSYKQAYDTEDNNVAGVMAYRLLRKAKVVSKIKEIEGERKFDLQTEVDEHIQNISTILKQVAEKGKYTRDDIAALKALGDFAGRSSNKGVNVNIDLRKGEKCPTCGTIPFDVRDLKGLKPLSENWQHLTDEELNYIKDFRNKKMPEQTN